MLTRPPRTRPGRPPRRFRPTRPALAALLLAAMLAPGTAVGAQPEGTNQTLPAAPSPSASTSTAPAPSREVALYFFSPDWRPPDLGDLAAAFGAAFESAGLRARFQAFNRYEDFKEQVSVSAPDFLIAPAWLESEARDRIGVEVQVVALPLREGKSSYRKALMARGTADSVDDLARSSVAATAWSMGPGTSEAVLAPFQLAGAGTRLVAVPKDLDALLALHYGQVEGALITGRDYEDFARTNAEGADAMRVVALSPDIPLPPVFRCTERAGEDDVAALVGVLQRLPNLPEGRKALSLLGFDAFAARGAREGRR